MRVLRASNAQPVVRCPRMDRFEYVGVSLAMMPAQLATATPHQTLAGSRLDRQTSSNSRPLPWQGRILILYSVAVENGL
jgi:hypothetical protein